MRVAALPIPAIACLVLGTPTVGSAGSPARPLGARAATYRSFRHGTQGPHGRGELLMLLRQRRDRSMAAGGRARAHHP